MCLIACTHAKPMANNNNNNNDDGNDQKVPETVGSNGCNTDCPGHDPVCGTDEKGFSETFKNICKLESNNCSKKTSELELL